MSSFDPFSDAYKRQASELQRFLRRYRQPLLLAAVALLAVVTVATDGFEDRMSAERVIASAFERYETSGN